MVDVNEETNVEVETEEDKLTPPKVDTRRQSARQTREFKDMVKRIAHLEELLTRTYNETTPHKYKTGRVPGAGHDLVQEIESALNLK
jgi:hypothetical protein